MRGTGHSGRVPPRVGLTRSRPLPPHGQGRQADVTEQKVNAPRDTSPNGRAGRRVRAGSRRPGASVSTGGRALQARGAAGASGERGERLLGEASRRGRGRLMPAARPGQGPRVSSSAIGGCRGFRAGEQRTLSFLVRSSASGQASLWTPPSSGSSEPPRRPMPASRGTGEMTPPGQHSVRPSAQPRSPPSAKHHFPICTAQLQTIRNRVERKS